MSHTNFVIVALTKFAVTAVFLFALTALTVQAQTSLTYTTPLPTTIDAARNANIVIYFDNPIDASTANNNTIIISGSQTGVIAGTFSTSGNTVTFNPTDDFNAGEIITVTVTDGVESGGAAIQNPFSWYFVTAPAPAPQDPPVLDRHEITTTATDGSHVHSADIDGDGDIDVLSTSFNDNAITWFENNGSQSFSLNTIAATGPLYASAVDIDRDGDMDILSYLDDDTIVWYENNGQANPGFSSHLIATAADNISSVYPADINGDGHIDIVSASYDKKIAWYENDGAATPGFGAANVISNTLNIPTTVHAVDVDGDGDMDVLASFLNGNFIFWYENDGNQNFTREIVTNTGSVDDLYAADVDGDNDIDVLAASSSDDKIAWYENDGSENFTAIDIATGVDAASDVYAADLDGDGNLDVLSASQFDDTIAWYESDGAADPGFTKRVVSASADGASAVYAADVDSDGDLDVLSASYADDTIAWYENRAALQLTGVTPDASSIDVPVNSNITITFDSSGPAIDGATANSTAIKVWGAQTGRINGSFSTSGNTVTFNPTEDFNAGEAITVTVTTGIKRTDGGSLGNPYSFSFTTAVAPAPADPPLFAAADISASDANGASDVYAADVDGDGDMDAVSASVNENTLFWHENDGSQNFTAHAVNPANPIDSPTSVYAADIDSDGDLDLMSASQADDRIAWWENNGSESFTRRTINFSADGAADVYAADVDGDGDMDALSASVNDDMIAWYENDGNESFTTHVIISDAAGPSSPDGATSVYAADVDSDGDIDVFSASFVDNAIVWYENDGSQNFTERVVSTNANGASDVYAADVDGDGDLDLMSASSDDDKIAWYENDGSQNFTKRVVTTNADGAQSVYAGDMDGDGDLDLMSASPNIDTIAWYENDGAANPDFTRRVVNSNADGALSVYAADMDSDGDLDLMSASLFGDKIAWYENAVPPPLGITQVQPLNATPGRSITIYGANFDASAAGNTVTFTPANGGAGTTATVTAASLTKLTVTVPTVLGGNYTVSVQRASDGQMTASQELVTITTGGGNFGTKGSSERLVSNDVNQPRSIYAGDIDGDGDLDLMSASKDDDTIAWYENTDGARTYGPQQVVSTTANGAQSVYAADVDGDGDLDLMSASEDDNKIAWYENDGNQNFTERVVSTTANEARSVYAGDVDGDGDLDLMSASSDDDKIAWYENDGAADPGFTEQVVSTNAGFAYDVYAADVDGDGDLDLMSTSPGDRKIAWYENDGTTNPGFTEQIVSTDVTAPSSVYAADVDRDGDLDLMMASNSKIAWYENDGAADPSFTEEVVSTASEGQSVYAGDIDGDGDLDLMSASTDLSKLFWYENDGNQNFTRRLIARGLYGANSVHAGDVDGDGDLDLISVDLFENEIAWYENVNVVETLTQVQPTNGTPGRAVTLYGAGFSTTPAGNDVHFTPAGGGASRAATVTAATSTKLTVTVPEVTGGNYTLEAGGQTAPNLFAVTTGGGDFGSTGSSERVVSTGATGARRVHAADVDGDGDLDLLSASRDDDKIAWYKNDGSQNFTEQVVSTTADGAYSVYAADVDSDGDMDLMSASENDDTIAWYENDGSQNFTEQVVSTTADGAYSVYAADVDGDGDLDLMSTSFGNDKIAWYENDGAADPSFTERGVSTGVVGARSVYAADIDSDGDMDVLSSSDGDNAIIWYENDGSQNFTERVVSTNANGAQSVYADDVDGDGDLDLMAASFSLDKIVWYENDGAVDPAFTERLVSTNADGAQSVYAGDVDADGDLDLLSASETDDKIVWYENDGAADPGFTERAVSTNANGAASVYAADVDGDGDLDLMSASQFDDKIAWYENAAPVSVAGRALDLNGTDQFVSIPDNSVYDDLEAMTFEAWIYPENISARGGLIEKHVSPSSGWWIDLNEDVTALFVMDSGTRSANSSITLQNEQWYHLAVQYDGTDVTIYIDGQNVTGTNSGSGSGTITNNNRPVQMRTSSIFPSKPATFQLSPCVRSSRFMITCTKRWAGMRRDC